MKHIKECPAGFSKVKHHTNIVGKRMVAITNSSKNHSSELLSPKFDGSVANGIQQNYPELMVSDGFPLQKLQNDHLGGGHKLSIDVSTIS